jgi:hypothetical protein
MIFEGCPLYKKCLLGGARVAIKSRQPFFINGLKRSSGSRAENGADINNPQKNYVFQ